MGRLSGKRVVGDRPAPTLDVVFKCGERAIVVLLDAYQGPPSCSGGNGTHLPVFMMPLRLADIEDYGVDDG
jgi:hypothetical protein